MSAYRMETRTRRDNYRLEVTVDDIYFRTDRKTPHDYKVMELQETKEKIKRHVDHITDITMLWDTAEVCMHCGTSVENAMTDDGPGCCDDAVVLYDAWKAGQA